MTRPRPINEATLRAALELMLTGLQAHVDKRLDTLEFAMERIEGQLISLLEAAEGQRSQAEVREALHQLWLEDKVRGLLNNNALWLREGQTTEGEEKGGIDL